MKLTIITIIHFFHLRLKCVERAMIVSQFFILFFFKKNLSMLKEEMIVSQFVHPSLSLPHKQKKYHSYRNKSDTKK